MCTWADVSESGYRAWTNRTLSPTATRRAELTTHIKRVYEESGQIYGYRKVRAKLKTEGIEVSEGTVKSVMAELGLVSCHPAPWRYVTDADGSKVSQDLINRDFTAERPGVRLVGDITQIDTWEGPIFLATVIDLFSREVVGYAMADNYRADLVCAAIVMAKSNRRTRRRAIFHSDHGSQYTSKKFRRCLRQARMRPSMGAVGTCYDNSVAEAFFASLKKELVHRTVFVSRAQAEVAVQNYVEIWYNRQRLHQTLGYQTPAAVREAYSLSTRAA